MSNQIKDLSELSILLNIDTPVKQNSDNKVETNDNQLNKLDFDNQDTDQKINSYFKELLDKYSIKQKQNSKLKTTTPVVAHQGLELFNSLNSNIESLKQAFTYNLKSETPLNLSSYHGIETNGLFSEFKYPFKLTNVYFLDELNDEQMSFIQYIIENRINPTSEAELGFLLYFSVQYFYNIANQVFPKIKENFIKTLNKNLNSEKANKDPNFKTYLNDYLEHINNYTNDPFLFSWAIHNKIGGCYQYNHLNKFSIMLLNHKGLQQNCWNYLIEIITHELGHWLDKEFSYLKELPKNWESIERFHSNQWVRLTQLAFNITPITFNTYENFYKKSNENQKPYYIYKDIDYPINTEDLIIAPNQENCSPVKYSLTYDKKACNENACYKVEDTNNTLVIVISGNLVIFTQSFLLNGFEDVIDNRKDKSKEMSFYINKHNVY